MGDIISSKILLNTNIIYKVLLDKEEALALKNSIKNVHLFSSKLFDKEAKMIERGRNQSTKYFEIPFSLRFRKKKSHKEISYQKLETPAKIFYIYVVHKNPLL